MNYISCFKAQRSPDAIPQTSPLHLRKVALVTRLNLRKLGSTSLLRLNRQFRPPMGFHIDM